MAAHSTLTGADLHEPKGADSAAADTVYIADGGGSGAWGKVDILTLDTSEILNLNKDMISVQINDLASASVLTIPIPVDCTLVNATSCINAAISGGDAVLTLSRAGAATIGTITVAAAGSGEGILDTVTSPVNNTFTAPSYLKITCDGGPTGGTSNACVILEFTLT